MTGSCDRLCAGLVSSHYTLVEDALEEAGVGVRAPCQETTMNYKDTVD